MNLNDRQYTLGVISEGFFFFLIAETVQHTLRYRSSQFRLTSLFTCSQDLYILGLNISSFSTDAVASVSKICNIHLPERTLMKGQVNETLDSFTVVYSYFSKYKSLNTRNIDVIPSFAQSCCIYSLKPHSLNIGWSLAYQV